MWALVVVTFVSSDSDPLRWGNEPLSVELSVWVPSCFGYPVEGAVVSPVQERNEDELIMEMCL